MSYFVFWCGHSRESNGYYYVTASWGPYDIIFTLSDGIIPLVLKSFSTPHKMIYNSNSIIIMVTTKKKKMYPGCLAHAVIGMFYSVVANQCQPQYAYFVQRCTGSVQTEANYNMYMGGGCDDAKISIAAAAPNRKRPLKALKVPSSSDETLQSYRSTAALHGEQHAVSVWGLSGGERRLLDQPLLDHTSILIGQPQSHPTHPDPKTSVDGQVMTPQSVFGLSMLVLVCGFPLLF